MKNSRQQRGNVLFLVLIGVALFALLAWAVTKSGTGSKVRDMGQLVLDSSEITQYANNLRMAVQRLAAGRGCNATSLNFYSANFTGYVSGDRNNSDAPSDKTCDVFDPAGGGMGWQAPPVASVALGASFYTISGLYGVSGVGTEASGDIMIFSYVTKPVCVKINEELGITNPSDNPPVEAEGPVVGTAATSFITDAGHNVYNDALNATSKVDSAQLTGKKTGCFSSTANSMYYFYAVLFPR